MSKQEKIDIKSEEKDQSVEKFKFEPIKGNPYLHWQGKRPFKSTQYFPAQKKESYGEPVDDWMNEIYWGDNLQTISHLLKRYRGKIGLIYIDPPFDSSADYRKKISLKNKSVKNDNNSFEEKQYTDIWSNDEYLQFMYERIILIKELLTDRGCIYLHADYRKVHELKLIMDEIFGRKNFQNEIIWCYRGMAVSTNHYVRRHDNILFYSKSNNYNFNWESIAEDFTEVTINKYKHTDKNGRQFRLHGRNISGSPIKNKTDIDIKWIESNPELVRVDYLDEKQGVKPRDWIVKDYINIWSNERVNYPTQKPEFLLEKFIKASSNPHDIIFDCFMGSGTTQAIAMKLGRKFIGADINLGAIHTTTERLIKVAKEINGNDQTELNTEDGIESYYTGFNVYNVNNYDFFRNPVEAKELLIEALEIQPMGQGNLYDGEKDGRMVKIMPVNRIATKADLSELITGFDYKTFERKKNENPNKPVEKLLIVCMGHEPDLKASLQKEVSFQLDIEVVDILRDRAELEFKRDTKANVIIKNGHLGIEAFYPMNLLQKLSIMKEDIDDWKELVDSIMID